MPDNNATKILLWAPRGADDNYWGPGTSALRLIEQAPSDITFDLVHAVPGHQDMSVFRKQTCLGNFSENKMSHLPAFLFRSYLWLKRNADNYDYFYGLTPYHYTVQPAVWAERFGLPATVKMTGLRSGLSGGHWINQWLKLPLKRRKMLREVSHIVSISEAITEELRNYGFSPPRLVQIPNGVNIERFKPLSDPEGKRILRQKLGLNDHFTILFVGGMSSRKQPVRNLDVMARLSEQVNKPVQAVFVGPERETGYLKKFQDKVRELGLTEQVKRFDYCENIEEFYQAADIFLLLSKNEGMANSLLEAMACGLPPYVTDISGTRDVIGDGRGGEMFSTDSIPEILPALIKVIEDADKRQILSKEARDKIMSRFSYNAIWTAYGKKCFPEIINWK
ncbi:MAG: glycosyltransferase [Lentisphaeria bacterium]